MFISIFDDNSITYVNEGSGIITTKARQFSRPLRVPEPRSRVGRGDGNDPDELLLLNKA